jgi:GntR family transcriptional regulator of vanillate catabolism
VLWDDHGLILRSHGDHHRIVEAVLSGDAQRAEHLMREHVYYAGVILKRHLERKSSQTVQASTRPGPR